MICKLSRRGSTQIGRVVRTISSESCLSTPQGCKFVRLTGVVWLCATTHNSVTPLKHWAWISHAINVPPQTHAFVFAVTLLSLLVMQEPKRDPKRTPNPVPAPCINTASSQTFSCSNPWSKSFTFASVYINGHNLPLTSWVTSAHLFQAPRHRSRKSVLGPFPQNTDTHYVWHACLRD